MSRPTIPEKHTRAEVTVTPVATATAVVNDPRFSIVSMRARRPKHNDTQVTEDHVPGYTQAEPLCSEHSGRGIVLAGRKPAFGSTARYLGGGGRRPSPTPPPRGPIRCSSVKSVSHLRWCDALCAFAPLRLCVEPRWCDVSASLHLCASALNCDGAMSLRLCTSAPLR